MKLVAAYFEGTIVLLNDSHFLAKGEVVGEGREFVDGEGVRNVRGIGRVLGEELELRFYLEVFYNVCVRPLCKDFVSFSLKNRLLFLKFFFVDLLDKRESVRAEKLLDRIIYDVKIVDIKTCIDLLIDLIDCSQELIY